MPKELTLNGTTFQYPNPGDEPGWGDDATAWAEEITDVTNSLFGIGDILETTFTLDNNISTFSDISGLNFNSTVVRGAEIAFSIYRRSDSNTYGFSEVGTMKALYDNDAPVNEKWQLSILTNGNSGVTFKMTDAGQIQFKSTNIGATNYEGEMHFEAKALLQV